MDYSIITIKIENSTGKYWNEILAEKIEALFASGWDLYGNASVIKEWYSDGSGGLYVSQGLIKTGKQNKTHYTVVFGNNIDKDVTLFLYKGWKLYGNPCTVLAGHSNICSFQALIKDTIVEQDLLSIS